MMVHTGLKPHGCQLCKKAFKNRVDLRHHYTRWHQVNVKKETLNVRAKYTFELPTSNNSFVDESNYSEIS